MKIFGVFNDLLPPRYLSNLMTAPLSNSFTEIFLSVGIVMLIRRHILLL